MAKKQKHLPIELMQQNAADAEAFLKQFANSNRLIILCSLAAGEKSVGEISESVGISQSALSQHLAKMREAGLVSADKRGQMVYYKISSAEAQALIATLYMLFCK